MAGASNQGVWDTEGNSIANGVMAVLQSPDPRHFRKKETLVFKFLLNTLWPMLS